MHLVQHHPQIFRIQFVELDPLCEYAVGIEHFRRALALRSSPVIAYNLASALEHLGQLVEASELLRGIASDPAVAA